MLERLHFFAEMNQIRTAFRWIYSMAFVSLPVVAPVQADVQLTLSIDGLTDAKRVNKSGFWSDMLYLSGHLSIFGASGLHAISLSHPPAFRKRPLDRRIISVVQCLVHSSPQRRRASPLSSSFRET